MTEARPRASLTHPLFLAALAALALNDHLLKGSGAWPALSGKLSDVAGLLVAPLVLAWMARVRTRRGFLACHVAVGLVFALHQVPAIATWLMAWLPVRIWADPTDLYALPALAVSFFVLGRAPHGPVKERGSVVVGVVALLLCVASDIPGSNAPPPRYPFPPAGVLETDLYIRNHLSADLRVGVRRIEDESQPDCDDLLRDPIATVQSGDFGDEQEWTVAARDAVPLWDRRGGAMTRDCYVVRLKARDTEWLIAWRHGTPPLRDVAIRLEPHESPEADAMRISEDPETPPNVPPAVTVRRWRE